MMMRMVMSSGDENGDEAEKGRTKMVMRKAMMKVMVMSGDEKDDERW